VPVRVWRTGLSQHPSRVGVRHLASGVLRFGFRRAPRMSTMTGSGRFLRPVRPDEAPWERTRPGYRCPPLPVRLPAFQQKPAYRGSGTSKGQAGTARCM
jgi:hypothetical protein